MTQNSSPEPLIRQISLNIPPALHRHLKRKRLTDILTQDCNTRETVTGQPPPTQATHDFFFFLDFSLSETTMYSFNTMTLPLLQKINKKKLVCYCWTLCVP